MPEEKILYRSTWICYSLELSGILTERSVLTMRILYLLSLVLMSLISSLPVKASDEVGVIGDRNSSRPEQHPQWSRLEAERLAWQKKNQELSERFELMQQKTRDLQALLRSDQSLPQEQYIILYDKIKDIWRALIDDGLFIYDLAFSEQLIASNESIPEDGELKQQFEQQLESFKQQRQEALEDKIDRYFKLFADVSEVRAQILTRLSWESLISDSWQSLRDDFIREIFAVPFRLFSIGYLRVMEVHSSLGNGLLGVWNLINNLGLLLVLFLVPWATRKTTRLIVSRLDRYRAALLQVKSVGTRGARQARMRTAFWIQRLTPYAPLVLYLVAAKLIQVYIVGTIYEELKLLIPILIYFIVYKIFRHLVADALFSIQGLVDVQQSDVKALIDSTTKIIGRFFLISFSVMHLTESTVDQGLVFSAVSFAIQLLGWLVWAYAINRWKAYLAPAAAEIYRNRLGQILNQSCQGRLSLLFCLPTLVLILIGLAVRAIWSWLEGWEVTKRFVVRIYRKRVESLENESSARKSQELDSSYTEVFASEQALKPDWWVDANQEAFKRIKAEIDGWLAASEDDQSLVIYGEKGIGKSCLLERLSRSFEQLDVVSITVPPKITDEQRLREFLSEKLQIEKSENLTRAMLEFNRSRSKKTIVLVDNAHNLFVGKVGGFEALRAFLDIINLSTENIFWCAAFNEYSWSYLKGIIGDSEFFRTEVYLSPWSDASIRSLIMKRHHQTVYRLSFDRLILASRSAASSLEAAAYAEEQFFRLLWEQSKGNPRIALHLWLRCLAPQGHQSLKVGLPERARAETISSISDTLWFVLSAVTNHENATRKEIADATNLELGAVSHAIKMGLEEKLLHRGDGNRYRLGFIYQYDIIRQLKAKNFIYGLD